jgi:hypothetical protein
MLINIKLKYSSYKIIFSYFSLNKKKFGLFRTVFPNQNKASKHLFLTLDLEHIEASELQNPLKKAAKRPRKRLQTVPNSLGQILPRQSNYFNGLC